VFLNIGIELMNITVFVISPADKLTVQKRVGRIFFLLKNTHNFSSVGILRSLGSMVLGISDDDAIVFTPVN